VIAQRKQAMAFHHDNQPGHTVLLHLIEQATEIVVAQFPLSGLIGQTGGPAKDHFALIAQARTSHSVDQTWKGDQAGDDAF